MRVRRSLFLAILAACDAGAPKPSPPPAPAPLVPAPAPAPVDVPPAFTDIDLGPLELPGYIATVPGRAKLVYDDPDHEGVRPERHIVWSDKHFASLHHVAPGVIASYAKEWAATAKMKLRKISKTEYRWEYGTPDHVTAWSVAIEVTISGEPYLCETDGRSTDSAEAAETTAAICKSIRPWAKPEFARPAPPKAETR